MTPNLTTDTARYPIGPVPALQVAPQELLPELLHLPTQLEQTVLGLSDEQLDTPYRVGGWTVRQVVHHVADSHLNAYLRTKLALTEAEPLIKPYDENLWAVLPDSALPVASSLELLRGLHTRWVALLEKLAPAQ